MAAGGAVIGALRVVIGADSAALETGLKRASSQLDAFASKMNKIGLGLGVGIAAAATALGLAIKGSINEADKLGKMAQSIGIPVEELSRLKHAADLSDVSLEALGKSVGILSKRMVAAAGDINGEAAQSFKNLGISVRNSDGTLKNSSLIITEVAGKFEGMKDGATKTALAMQIFGRAGAAMIPLLNQGAAGLKAMMDEADELGIVLDTKTAFAAEAFNDNLKRMGKLWDGIILQVTARMLPAFLQMSQVMLDTAKNSDLMQTAADGIVTAIRGSVTVALTAVVAFQRLTTELGAFWEVLKSLKTFDPTAIAAAWASFRSAGEETEARFAGLKDFIDKFWADSAVAAQTGSAKQKKGFEDIAIASSGAGKAIQSFLDSQAKQLAGQQAELAAFGMAAGAKEKLKIQLEGLAIATANHTRLSAAQKAAIDATGTAAEQMALKLAGMKLVEEVTPAWQRQNTEMERARAALGAIGASAEVTSAVLMRIQFPSLSRAIEEAGNLRARIDDLATSSMNNLSSALSSIVMGTEKASKAFKKFAMSVVADLVTMIAKALVFKTLASLIGFSGGGSVSGFPGFKMGGLIGFPSGGFVSGPGSSTSDSIFAKLSDGEFVVNAAATKQNLPLLEAINDGDTGGINPAASIADNRTLTVKGINSKQLYTGDMLRGLAENLIKFQRDGGKVFLAPA